MAVVFKIVVEIDEIGEFGEEFGVFGLKIGLVEQFDGGFDDLQSVFAGVGFDFGEVGGEFNKFLIARGDKLFGGGEDFRVFGGWLSKNIFAAWIENLGARQNSRQKRRRMLGEKDKMAEIARFFESFEKSIHGGDVHSVGGSDDEEAVGSLAVRSESTKVANLLGGDNFGGFGSVRTEIKREWQVEFDVGRDDEDGATGAPSDGGDLGETIKEHR